jgi:hypothetical protein
MMEEDEDIFKSILQPLIVEPVAEVSKKLHLEAQGALDVFEEEVKNPLPTIVCLNQNSA